MPSIQAKQHTNTPSKSATSTATGPNYKINKKAPVEQKSEPVDAAITTAVEKIQAADASINWVILKVENGTIQLSQQGEGDIEQMKSHLSEDQVLYVYLRQPIGSDRRNKFVYLKWIGDSVRPMQRARALDDSKRVGQVFKTFHMELAATKQSEVQEQTLVKRLQAAAGANYDKEQNAAPATADKNAHEFNSYKRTSKDFFQNIEKNGNLGNVVYETKAIPKSTPVDLSHRAMTAGAANAKANIVDLKIASSEVAEEH